MKYEKLINEWEQVADSIESTIKNTPNGRHSKVLQGRMEGIRMCIYDLLKLRNDKP